MKTHKWDDVKAARNLPPEKRAELDRQIWYENIKMLFDLLCKEPELTLAELRSHLGLTQKEVAGRMGIEQGNLSRMEHRGNCKVSTIRRYIKALGGELEIFVRIDGKTIRLLV